MSSCTHVFIVSIVFYNMFVLFLFVILVFAHVSCPDNSATHPNIVFSILHCSFYLDLYVCHKHAHNCDLVIIAFVLHYCHQVIE